MVGHVRFLVIVQPRGCGKQDQLAKLKKQRWTVSGAALHGDPVTGRDENCLRLEPAIVALLGNG